MAGRTDSLEPATMVTGKQEFVLGIPPTPDQVRTARLFAAAVARHFGCDEERIEDLKLAISEACTNSIKAHRHSEIGDSVHVLVRRQAEWLRFDVVDSGPGFESPSAAPGADAEVTPALGLLEGSLGLAVIRSLFPEVEIRRNADRGMTVSFALRAGGQDGAE